VGRFTAEVPDTCPIAAVQLIVNTGLAFVIILTAPTLHAQERHGAVQLRAGAALGAARTSVGGEKSTDVGPLLTGQFGLVLSPRTDLVRDWSSIQGGKPGSG
jgi:hypothetical protein